MNRPFALGSLVLLVISCSRSGVPLTHGADQGRDARALDPRAAGQASCSHMVCKDEYVVDAASGPCALGATCTVALTLAAAGDYHINDEYPYRFKAEPIDRVVFLGTDPAGSDVFSKAAHDWTRSGEKTGTMKVTFRPERAGSTMVDGVFKLSVCSAQTCRLEQERLRAVVQVR